MFWAIESISLIRCVRVKLLVESPDSRQISENCSVGHVSLRLDKKGKKTHVARHQNGTPQTWELPRLAAPGQQATRLDTCCS